MKKIAAFMMVGLIYLSPGICSPNSAKVAILLDNSGSMKGFYGGSQYLQLADIIKESQGGGETLIFQFNQNGPERINDIHDSKPSKNDTRIDKALADVIDVQAPDIIWILTDNYQDAPGVGEPGDIEAFYNRLLSDDIKKINIFPVSILFDGNLTLYCDQHGNPVQKQSSVYYQGKKGLLVYSILINETKSPEYNALINSVSQRYASPAISSRPLLCKPLSADTVALDICQAPQGLPRSNLEFTGGGFVGKGFREGERIEAFFYTKLKSSFRYLRLMDADLKGEQAGPFRTEGFHKPEVQSRVAPDKLANPLEPGLASGIIYRVNIDIEKLRLKKDIRSIVHAALNDNGLVGGRMLLLLEVPEESFRFTDEILAEHNTDNICDMGQDNQRKIYGMGKLIPKMTPKIVSIPMPYSLKLEVKYPKWPLVMLVVGLLFAVLALFGAYKVLSSIGSVKYEIKIDEGDPIIFGLGPFMPKSIKLGDTIGLKVSKKLSKAVIGQTANGFVFADEIRTRRLEDQDAFTVSREAGDSYVIRFARLSDKKRDDGTDEATTDQARGDDYADF
jgi:hypothetical protein